MSELPKAYGGRPFRAIVIAHNDRGGCNLCIGAEGYSRESYVVLSCTEEERRQFPIGTQFDLVCVEDTRGTACEQCGGSGRRKLTFANNFEPGSCPACSGSGREKGKHIAMKLSDIDPPIYKAPEASSKTVADGRILRTTMTFPPGSIDLSVAADILAQEIADRTEELLAAFYVEHGPCILVTQAHRNGGDVRWVERDEESPELAIELNGYIAGRSAAYRSRTDIPAAECAVVFGVHEETWRVRFERKETALGEGLEG